jgi:D-specific alpha-keto acid dehydrogenase
MKKFGITIYGCEPDEAELFQNIAQRFGVVPTITAAVVSEANTVLAAENRCISVSHKAHLTRPILRALSQTGVTYISTRSIGYNHIDVDFAKSIGIQVGNISYSPDSVADYTLMLILMSIRDAKPTIEHVANQDFRLNRTRGKELRDMTVGVVGTGRIGTAVIKRLEGFGCAILAYDHHPKATAQYVSLDELLRRSDVITLHTPLNIDTYHLLDQQRIAQMKHGSYIINTGRGGLLDTQALIVALKNGHLGGAALDVIEKEEGIFYTNHTHESFKDPALLDLLQLANVIITPHVAYYTDHSLRDIVENTVINCVRFEKDN